MTGAKLVECFDCAGCKHRHNNPGGSCPICLCAERMVERNSTVERYGGMLSAQTIRERVESNRLCISPFHERAVVNGRSYGLSSCGYDVRLREDLWLWPGYGRLASIIEYLSLPDDLSAEVKDKSTNARMFVLVQNTIIEPGWRGFLTVELTRFLPWPIHLKAGTPIAQVVFHLLDKPTEIPYTGKYQNQRSGPQKARFDRRFGKI